MTHHHQPHGTAPTAADAVGIDWSSSPVEATVGQLVEASRAMDRLAAETVEALIRTIESQATEQTLGVPPELVLSQTCRAVGSERKVLLVAATTLVHMPGVRQAFREGWISWSQVRAILTAVRPLDLAGRDEVDVLVGRLAYSYMDMEADALVWEVEILADSLRAVDVTDRQRKPVEANRTWFSPRLDGSGSSYSEYDADLYPLYVQAVENQANARHRLEDEPDIDEDETDDAALTAAHQHAATVAGRNATRRAKAQFELVTGKAADTLEPLDDHPRPSGKPSVLVVAPIDSLVDGSTPAWLLSTLAGRVKITGPTLQRWMANGADTRLIGIDDAGEVVGVGRRSRYARGALRDAIIARDLHDTAPCSTTPALLCDVDHVVDWDHGGRTDAPNLTVLSRRWHTHKTKGRWKLQRHPDGTRTWTNTWSGYRIRQPRPTHLPRGRDGPAPRPDTGGP